MDLGVRAEEAHIFQYVNKIYTDRITWRYMKDQMLISSDELLWSGFLYFFKNFLDEPIQFPKLNWASLLIIDLLPTDSDINIFKGTIFFKF